MHRQQRQRLIGGASWCVMMKMVVGELLLSTERRLFGDLCRLLNLGGQMVVETIHQCFLQTKVTKKHMLLLVFGHLVNLNF